MGELPRLAAIFSRARFADACPERFFILPRILAENLVEQFLVDGCGHDSGDTFHGETYGAGYGIGFCMADALTLMVAVRKGFIDIEFNSSAGGNADEFFLFLFFDVADDDAGLFAAEVGSGVFQETL